MSSQPPPVCAPVTSSTPSQVDAHTTPHRRRRRRCCPSRAYCVNARALGLLLLPPAIVIVALNVSRAYALLFVCQIVLALGALELTWWYYRIRKRLLIPLLYGDENLSHAEFMRLRFDEMHPVTQAVSPLADRLCGGRLWLATLLVSTAFGGSVTAGVVAAKHSIVDSDIPDIGWRVVVISTALSASLSALCGCFAPTARDALMVLMYQSCFTLASLNSFLAHYNHFASDPTMLDSLYVVLVGACLLVVWRITTNKEVLETALAIALDLFGLVFLTAPMMEVAEFFERKGVKQLGDKVAAFWIVVCAAEVGHWLHMRLRARFPCVLPKCHTPLAKKQFLSHKGVEDLAVSTCSGIVGLAVTWLAYPNHQYELWELCVLMLAALLSQVGRLGVATMRAVAMLDNIHADTSADMSDDTSDDSGGGNDAHSGSNARSATRQASTRLWNSGVMTLLSPYLVAAIVFHPYIKSLFTSLVRAATTAAAAGSATGSSISSNSLTV